MECAYYFFATATIWHRTSRPRCPPVLSREVLPIRTTFSFSITIAILLFAFPYRKYIGILILLNSIVDWIRVEWNEGTDLASALPKHKQLFQTCHQRHDAPGISEVDRMCVGYSDAWDFYRIFTHLLTAAVG